MITYEYICDACKHEWETEQNIKDEPIKKCPKCECSQAKRLIANSGSFILKGDCWADDHYGLKSKNKKEKT